MNHGCFVAPQLTCELLFELRTIHTRQSFIEKLRVVRQARTADGAQRPRQFGSVLTGLEAEAKW